MFWFIPPLVQLLLASAASHTPTHLSPGYGTATAVTTWSTADQDGWAEDGISYYKYRYVYHVYECVRACVRVCVRARARKHMFVERAHA